MASGINDLNVGLHIFVISEYQNSQPQLSENEKHNFGTCSRKMYYCLTFPRAKKYKTIHDELTITQLLPEQTE